VGGGGASCPTTTTKQEVIVSTLIQPTQSPIAKVVWCNQVNAGGGHMNFPPISTTTDGASANALVWFMEGQQLAVVDGDTGARVFTTTGAACTGVPSMSFPIAVKNRIVVAALGHLCSWSPGGT
jgi:cellulase/cellobiase CelA1